MKIILTEKEVQEVIEKIMNSIINSIPDLNNLVFVGMLTRGYFLALRIQSKIKNSTNINIPVGKLDITFYRDDVDKIFNQPVAKETDIPFDLRDKIVILIDDVLFTGRSIRAALDEIMDFGRPKLIKLAVLIERGHRELPIQADFIGETVKSEYNEEVKVELKEVDGIDRVIIQSK